ncbi:MAG: MarR family transcriptional regulator [Eubacterium sp.]|nr:MarR family transcriptional regulator [Eubacterium sp.]MCR4846467.1 MarR family transcriptional regulator [Eubacterium sp.]
MRDSNPLSAVYSKFRALYYRDVLHKVKLRELSLTTSEVYCVDIIHNLNKPTIQEFSNFIGISSPNATYKVNSLIKKGYLKKVQSETDKREYYLDVTEKYYRYYNINQKYLDIIENRLKETLSEEEFNIFNNTLIKIYDELIPEIPLDE